MELWVGPAIVAAIVAGLVNVLGWFVTSWQAQRLDERRRTEKVRDFQVALRAEIESDLLNLAAFDLDAHLADIKARYGREPGFSVSASHLAPNVIFAALLDEIHVLPEQVIRPVVQYQRLRQTADYFVRDMREPSFPALSTARQLEMYSGYLQVRARLAELARRAIEALDAALA